ncbi:MAG: diguanylate cyclase [Silicimonas sp.]|nr:diguanylate cyclase [Silicimonas sp.]
MLSHLLTVVSFGLGAFLSAYAALALTRRRFALGRESGCIEDDTLVFLIRDGVVADANFPAHRMLDGVTDSDDMTDRLRLFLARHFENPDRFLQPDQSLKDTGEVSRDGQIQILQQAAAGSTRLKISFVTDRDPGRDDFFSLHALENELETLRANTAAAPFLLWRQNAAGEIVWVNQAYLNAVETYLGNAENDSWPLATLFPTLRPTSLAPNEPHRIAIHGNGAVEDAWFDCHTALIGTDVLCTAIPADEAVKADSRRREFTQTLTKTFAELAIGLAIFDRSRRLVLFNPALLDLTVLPTDFLTSRPSLVGFLDHLRENRVMPEPRDYRTWRTSIAELEAAAVDGTYSETWSLPDGQTYHVTGRPHPDGAVALLFEVISAEMSLTRRFRAEIEQSQAAIDAFDDAVAVFSQAGELTLSNHAYCKLWNTDPENGLGAVNLTEATRQWHALSTPTPVWGDFRDFAQLSQDREEWSATVSLLNGQSVLCRFLPQKAGATMVIFHVQSGSSARASLREAG